MTAHIVLGVIVVLAILITVPILLVHYSSDIHKYLSLDGKPGRNFYIDGKYLYKDDESYSYVSGSIHYARIPPAYWFDRLQKMKYAGLDAVQVYVMWNLHEPSPLTYDFEGGADLVKFIKIAHSLELLVILRPGPYVCAEWEYGGLPAWILKDHADLAIRTSDKKYFGLVKRWFDILLPKMKPLLYVNGGPIIMVQVENEYGSFGACDRQYMQETRDLLTNHLGGEVLLFTTDGNSEGYLKCGAIDNVFSTVDFGVTNDVVKAFEPMQKHNKYYGPLINSEFYAGWLDVWGGKHANVSTTDIISTMKEMLDMGASFNIYMFVGGTNFGYMNGCEDGGVICVTSYDYDAPISESGDLTPKYLQIRDLLLSNKKSKSKNFEIRNVIPHKSPRLSTDTLTMEYYGTVMQFMHVIGEYPVLNEHILSMEQIGQNYGFILYSTTLNKTYPYDVLDIKGLRDRGYVFVNGYFRGLLSTYGISSMNLLAQEGDVLDIFVENQGRINYGNGLMYSRKGIISEVKLGNDIIHNWKMTEINLNNLFKKDLTKFTNNSTRPPELRGPSVFRLEFDVDELNDTFLDMTGWFKGVAILNGFNLGRYWPARGPTRTLYVPASEALLKTRNVLIIIELDNPSPDLSVRFVKTPLLL